MRMLRLAIGSVVSVWTFGCATGAPAGGSGMLTANYRSFTRPAAPRTIPADVQLAHGDDRPRLSPDSRDQVVGWAKELVGKRQVRIAGQSYREDCTGLVIGVMDQLGVDVLRDVQPGDNAVTAIYRYAARTGRVFDGGRPLPGDLVFFRQTYDQNRDGHSNDGLTHIGLVEKVSADGTVTVIHRVSRGVVRYRMNLANPDVRRDPKTGRILNDYLRHAGPGRRELLTGQLFAAFATILPTGQRVVASR